MTLEESKKDILTQKFEKNFGEAQPSKQEKLPLTCEICGGKIHSKPSNVPEWLWEDWLDGMGASFCEKCYAEEENKFGKL